MRAMLMVVMVAVLMSAVELAADDRSVTFDKGTDFAPLKTFTVRDVRVTSSRPELGNALFAMQVHDAIRDALAAKGLKETSTGPQLVVESSVTGIDYSVGPAGRANPIPPGRAAPSFAPVSFTEGTLVIDLKAADSGKLVWHGVYRRPKDSAGKLAEKLPGDARKLLSEFPPKKK
jgi:uncharacterized protein DUF4136